MTREQLAEATGLAKQWSAGVGLMPLTFSLAANELVMGRGRAGSGKSTRLALLAGWIEPDAGPLVRCGAWNGIETPWRGTAIAPQVLAPIVELTMTENVALALRLSGSTWREARHRARAMLD